MPTGTNRPPPSLPDSRPSRGASKFETTPLASAGTFARPPAQGLARRRRPDPARPAGGKPGPWRRARSPEALVPRSQCPGQVPMVRARRRRPGGCRQQALTAQGAAMAGPRAPKAPQEPEEAAAAVAARSVSAPPTAANSNAGRVPSPRPPRLKETRRLGYLLPYRKQSCRVGSTASALTFARPGGLWTAPPKASGHRRSSSLRISKALAEAFAPPARSPVTEPASTACWEMQFQDGRHLTSGGNWDYISQDTLRAGLRARD